MLDYLGLTIDLPPDKDYLEGKGDIIEDVHMTKMYKFMCQLERARILFYPHKFREYTNAKMPFSNVILNPKYFNSYET